MPSATTPQRRQWNSNIHDLSVYRATKLEREQRRLRHQSPNVDEARQELEERRRALAGGNFKHVLAALDQHNRAASAQTAGLSTAWGEMVPEDDDAEVFAADEAPALEVPTTLTMRTIDFEEASAAGPVDMDREMEQFRRRSAQRLVATVQAEQDAARVNSHTSPAPSVAARPPGPEPVFAPTAEAVRRPDKLGLARLQHVLQRLETSVGDYEQQQCSGVPPVAISADKTTKPTALLAAKLRRGINEKRDENRAAPVSYLGCGEKTVELLTRFAGRCAI